MIDQQKQLQQGETIRLTIEGMGYMGEALAHLDDTPIFVANAIPGEEVIARVLRRRRRYIAAEAVEILKPSPHRVAAPCPYYGPCSGCQWQHIAYEYQLEMKRTLVVEQLRRIGKFEEAPVRPVLPSEPWGYRNHARFTIRREEGALGFVHKETRRWVRIDRCLLMHESVNQPLAQLQGRCGETTQLSIRVGIKTGSLLVQPTLKEPSVPLPSGQTHYEDELLGRRFRVASSSFFQVNILQAERMVQLMQERLALSGAEYLVDAYAGVGTFAILLAPHARRVIAMEESPSAVKDARANAHGISNITFVEEKTETALGKLAERPDAVILDPPRVGCHPQALAALIALGPPRVVYISCDPAALGRDLRVLCDGGYRLAEVQPIDMFPQTYHVECVATLER